MLSGIEGHLADALDEGAVPHLGLDESEIFNAYHEVKSIRDKDEFLIPFIDTLTDPHFKTGTHVLGAF